jgi:hypothetical protein
MRAAPWWDPRYFGKSMVPPRGVLSICVRRSLGRSAQRETSCNPELASRRRSGLPLPSPRSPLAASSSAAREGARSGLDPWHVPFCQSGARRGSDGSGRHRLGSKLRSRRWSNPSPDSAQRRLPLRREPPRCLVSTVCSRPTARAITTSRDAGALQCVKQPRRTEPGDVAGEGSSLVNRRIRYPVVVDVSM